MRWCLLLVLLQYLLIVNAKYIMEILYFGNCKQSDSTAPLRFENTNYGMVSSDISEFNSTMVATQDFGKIQGVLTIYKCKEDNCESLMRLTSPDHCGKLLEKGQFWAKFCNEAIPPVKCPIKKGSHQLLHARVEDPGLMHFAEEHYFYRLDFNLTYKDKYAGCWRAKAKKTRVRNRKS